MDTTIIDNRQLLEVAVEAALAGSSYAVRERARNRDANMISSQDVKLKLDVECQAVISETIHRHFPNHFVLGEEDMAHVKAPAGSYEWIVDPIDGTVNFFHGSNYWCSSVAVRRDGEMLAGCVSAPDAGLRFEAAADGPAICNGATIEVSDTDDMTLAMVHTGADKSINEPQHAFRFFTAIAGATQRTRICGAAALDLCMVAKGAADGYFEGGIFIWDIAAADLILRRAGGDSSCLKDFGGCKLAYLASNGKLQERLEAILSPMF